MYFLLIINLLIFTFECFLGTIFIKMLNMFLVSQVLMKFTTFSKLLTNLVIYF